MRRSGAQRGADLGGGRWGGVSPFKMHYSIAFKYQSITGRPPLGEILYPPLAGDGEGYRSHLSGIGGHETC